MSDLSYDVRRREVAKALAERKVGENMQSVADRAGVGRATVFRYLEDEDFCETVLKLTAKAFVRWVPQVDRALVAKALEGSVGAQALFYKRANVLAEGAEDADFRDFCKRLDTATRDEVEFHMKHGRWPDEPNAHLIEGPEEAQ